MSGCLIRSRKKARKKVSLEAEIFNLKLFAEVPEIFLHSSPLANRIVAGPWQFKVFQGLPNCTKGKSQGFFLADFNSRDGVF